MIQQSLCDAFCAEVMVTPVPIGFAVRTPHVAPDGDYAGFYLRRHETLGEHYRIEDDGCTVADLESAGFDLDKESRFDAFVELLSEHGIRYDDRDILLTTDYMAMDAIGKAAVSFSYFMARVKDLTLLVGSRGNYAFNCAG